MKRIAFLPVLSLFLIFTLVFSACDGGGRDAKGGSEKEKAREDASSVRGFPEETSQADMGTDPAVEKEENAVLQCKIGDTAVSVEWEDNASVQTFRALCAEKPLVIPLSMYGGFEQVGDIGKSLPQEDTRITTLPGDIVLYAGDQIVLFYGSNTWAYTRLGKITGQSQSELERLLGNGDVTVTFTLREP